MDFRGIFVGVISWNFPVEVGIAELSQFLLDIIFLVH